VVQKVDLTDKVINGVRVLRRDPDNYRYWICMCPLCHDEFRVRVDMLREQRVRRCNKHSLRYQKMQALKQEALARSTPSTPEDEAEHAYGAVAVTRTKRKQPGRKSRDDLFVKRTFDNSLLRAVERLPDHNGQQMWIFQCACGGKVQALRGNVVAGKTRSCGCLPRGRPAGRRKRIDGPPAMTSPTAFLDLLK
jgi:hypothetical protein